MQPIVPLDNHEQEPVYRDKLWKIIQHIYKLFTSIDRAVNINNSTLRRVTFTQAIQIPKLNDKNAEPYTMYHSIESDKLVYKDDNGSVNELY
jgi:hypothetical protein